MLLCFEISPPSVSFHVCVVIPDDPPMIDPQRALQWGSESRLIPPNCSCWPRCQQFAGMLEVQSWGKAPLSHEKLEFQQGCSFKHDWIKFGSCTTNLSSTQSSTLYFVSLKTQACREQTTSPVRPSLSPCSTDFAAEIFIFSVVAKASS